MTSAIIDFEGFQCGHNRFIVKELAVYVLNSPNIHNVWTFKSPFLFENLNKKKRLCHSWVTRNLHGIEWNYGDEDYKNLRYILTKLFQLFTRIYIKGLEKKRFLEYLSGRDILNLEDVNCPKIEHLPHANVQCPHHTLNHIHCALYKAIGFGNFLLENTYKSQVPTN